MVMRMVAVALMRQIVMMRGHLASGKVPVKLPYVQVLKEKLLLLLRSESAKHHLLQVVESNHSSWLEALLLF